ncbi:G-type lectin S-receptor-like serine/threonine-protein kinase At4g27290 isoform X1 [Neltuma alba]|uniref:G-type lectin S-receptor-like serine/threonine-protein kinase At4g27290 isoform X1 n=1 Tax=Neltuma alba TaxID=207710 RepID=UPI0010A324DB|nr:G-type lectin S-receptor-like serine/threonine-protein kinase At4g27290 isoform X1 [Prosopis alba]
MGILCFLIINTYLLPSFSVSVAVDSIAPTQFIRDGMTLVSQGGDFELGFFSPGKSKKRYLGIWYKNVPIQTVVWVANRVNPINGSSGILTLTASGNLVLRQNDTVVWQANSEKTARNPVVQLLDSGNLVLREENEANSENYLWQSFDFPSDTLMPGMKFGYNLKKGKNWTLTAWTSPDDPAPGDFSCVTDTHNYPDSALMRGDKVYSRFGPWNGLHTSGSPDVKPNPVYYFKFIYNKEEISYTYYLTNSSVYSRIVMNQTDYIRYRYVWVEANQNWMVYKSKPVDYCDHYGLCGANGNCIITESPVCQCLKGFNPKSPQAWNSMDWSAGCVRNEPLNCSEDGFIKLQGLKVPDTTHTWLDETMALEECRQRCLNNCSCTAFTNSDVRGQGIGCAMWFGDLMDIRQFASGGQDLYVRMAASELEVGNRRRKKLIIIVATTIAATSGMLLVGCYFICNVRRNMTDKAKIKEEDQHSEGSEDDADLTLLDLPTIADATNNFSLENKIGQGGFGTVYKGKLVNGKLIAVKRLSMSSRQGLIEFKNEVRLIARLQHRNLVKLLGCCLQGQEKMLVYEYMPNGSLNSFIFDENRGKLLDWPKRFNIICSIARGLMYLHQDSRLRIIHRDLKASNILLDEKLNPKISDFGMAKTFGGEQIEGNTNRVVGTYGYMAPEYAADGLFSTKSDVFSFGILVMEIIYGKRNRGFYNADRSHNLICHAWLLWKEGRALELIDRNIEETYVVSEIMRCIHISLLCVQQHPEDRPSMSSVVLMLGSENELNEPKQPGFFTGKATSEASSSSSHQMQSGSTNEITLTLLEAR